MRATRTTTADGVVTLHLSGNIDYVSSDTLRNAIASVEDDVAGLVLDMTEVPYITSAGLRELLVCRRRFMGDKLRIVNVTPEAMNVFRMVGFDQMLPIEPIEQQTSAFIYLTFKELLSRRAKETPDRLAFKTEQGGYTWRDVDQVSQIIASDLEKLGVSVGSHVGICGRNSVNWLLTYCATQKLGALAMLINPNQTAEEIGRLCATADVTVLCCGEIPAMKNMADFTRIVRGVEGSRVGAVYSIRNSTDFRKRLGKYDALRDRFDQALDPDAPGVVIFTSGSTGRPKGVILSSFNLFNAAAVQVKLMNLTDRDKGLLIVPLYHILGLVVCLYPSIIANAPLVIPDDIHSETIIRIMKKERCTLMHSVPTLILALVNNSAYDPEAFESLRCTYLAGAAASEAQTRMFMRKMPDNHFMIAYGLSEMAPVSVTLYDDTEEHLLHTIGKPVENIQVMIQNRDTGRECPVGEAGEILVQGFNLMTGYYKLPLEDQPFDEKGWLHTGDMGMLDQDGYLRLLGRYKELILRGGENIMPAEVAAAVSTLECVEDVKVVGVPSDFYGEEVAACLKLRPGRVWDEQAARAALEGRLARYKIPGYFFLFDAFPTLDSGKTDLVALKREAEARARASSLH